MAVEANYSDARTRYRIPWITWMLLFSLLPQGFVIAVSDRTPMVAAFDIIMVVICVWAGVSATVGRFKFDFSESTILLLSSSFVFANLLSFFANPTDVLRSILAIKIFLFGVLAYVLVRSTVRSSATLEMAIDGLVLWGVSISILLVYQLLTAWQFEFDKDEVGIGMGRSNYLAAMIVPIIPIAACRAFQKRGWKRVLGLVFTAAIVGALLITLSRGAFASLIVAFAITLPLSAKAGLRVRHVLLGLAIVGLLVLALPEELLTTSAEMISYRLSNPDYNRIELWTVAWNAFVDHPLLGVGPNIIYAYNRQFAIADLYSHNYVLNVLADLGIVGAFPFLLLVGYLLLRNFRICRDSMHIPRLRLFAVGSFIGLVATLLHGLVEPTFQGQQYLVVFWVIIALVHSYELLHLSQTERIDHADPAGLVFKRIGEQPR